MTSSIYNETKDKNEKTNDLPSLEKTYISYDYSKFDQNLPSSFTRLSVEAGENKKEDIKPSSKFTLTKLPNDDIPIGSYKCMSTCDIPLEVYNLNLIDQFMDLDAMGKKHVQAICAKIRKAKKHEISEEIKEAINSLIDYCSGKRAITTHVEIKDLDEKDEFLVIYDLDCNSINDYLTCASFKNISLACCGSVEHVPFNAIKRQWNWRESKFEVVNKGFINNYIPAFGTNTLWIFLGSMLHVYSKIIFITNKVLSTLGANQVLYLPFRNHKVEEELNRALSNYATMITAQNNDLDELCKKRTLIYSSI